MLSFVSYNLHGLKQGIPCLLELMQTRDIICVQEHWLPTCDLGLLNIHDDFIVFSTSSMDSAVSKGPLRGRPFGGLAIFIKKDIIAKVNVIAAEERFLMINLNDIILCDVYLPSKSCRDYLAIYESTLCDIKQLLTSFANKNTIVCGDFNVSFNSSSYGTRVITEFCDLCQLSRTDHLLTADNLISFRSLDGLASSLIDYFLVSKCLINNISNICIEDSGCNVSDHCPVIMTVFLPMSCKADEAIGECYSKKNLNNNFKLRWDKANLDYYYNCSWEYLCHDQSWVINCLRGDVNSAKESIEFGFNFITWALNKASNTAVPKIRANKLKCYWDEELQHAKQESIRAHKEWCVGNKPKCGFLFQNMHKCRNEYKIMLNHKDNLNKNNFSDSLADSLMSKNGNNFWNSWNAKFKNNTNTAVINGQSDPGRCAEEFADYFKLTYNVHSHVKHEEFLEKFNDMFSKYDDSEENNLLSVADLDWCINLLKKGKAAGTDGLTVEHLIYCHPILKIFLTILFNACLHHKYVPNSFGSGMLIPIFKDGSMDKTKPENYRGITISNVLSKLFEVLLLKLYDNYLGTSDLQFGFKKSVGCRDAILAARLAIKFMTNRGCTVSLCSLDLSKAFDKVDLPCLLIKLMNRKLPKTFIAIILCWYNKCYVAVRWNGVMSTPFKVLAGVRQGGILSPCLFAIYINGLIIKLQNCGLGLYVQNIFMGCLVYADDILLLSNSIVQLQMMIDICSSEISELNMKFNTKKSYIVRIGDRCMHSCADIFIDGQAVNYTNSLKYLGVTINNARKFSCSFDSVKASFYKAFNCIYSKSKASNSELISVHLLKSICIPVILFSIEAILPNKTTLYKLNNVIDNAIRKIFNVGDINNVKTIRKSLGIMDVRAFMIIHLCKFINIIRSKSSVFYRFLGKLVYEDFKDLCHSVNIWDVSNFKVASSELIDAVLQ
jgi:exonuclease III